MTRFLLGADIGGTHSRFALAPQTEGSRQRIVRRGVFPSRSSGSLEGLLHQFLSGSAAATIAAAAIAVAGPVHAGRAVLTNLPWEVDAAKLERQLSAPVALLNDFSAVAFGLSELDADDLLTLQAGTPVHRAPRLLVGAGTGLGVAQLIHDGTAYRPLPSEGGHTDFAPQGTLQMELLRHLAQRHGHVSWERVVSGLGIEAIYEFLCERAGRIDQRDAAEIGAAALAGSDPISIQTIDLFVAAYGAFAGNLALTLLPRGGVYVAGGVAPRILPKLTEGTFMEAFADKGRFRELMAELPVCVVRNDDCGLLGALAAARELAAPK